MKKKIEKIIIDALGGGTAGELSVPDAESFGHYSTNIAMRLAKEQGKKPLDLAREFAATIAEKAPKGFFEKVEAAAPGFVNFWLSDEALTKEFAALADNVHYGEGNDLTDKTVMIEFTDPNPFKLFHIGHLMSNTIGESFSRLNEAAGAKVIRANYQGDVGLHVAKSIWGMQKNSAEMPDDHDGIEKKVAFLGAAYVAGTVAYDAEPEAKDQILTINKRVYARDDATINALYDQGKKWSLEYFSSIYERLGMKFDHYFFESEVGKDGLDVIAAHKNVFKESDGAIVFPGEAYGLHTRVFVNSQGLPTYEAKELGLNKKKFELYPLDQSIIITGNEIIDYFKVLLKAMELTIPDVAKKTRHVPHGMLRLPGGKMSSRTGDVITADALLAQLKTRFAEQSSEHSELAGDEREAATEAIAIGAIKYSILKQNPGQDIIFDFDTSLSLHGDSGPYLQYAYARLRSILRKAESGEQKKDGALIFESDIERALVRKIFELPDVIAHAREAYVPSALATYLHKLASAANKFYEMTPILKDDNENRRNARLKLVEIAARTLGSGRALLGIATLERM